MKKAAAFSSAAMLATASVPSTRIHPGIDMPMMAFGSASTSFKGVCTVQDGVEQWLQLGGRHIDTADDYGTQPDVGRALKASGVPRKDIFITTKIPGPIGAKAATDKILNTALKQLQVDYLDLVLIHFPCKVPAMVGCGSAQKAERLDTFKGLQELRKAGKIRAIGVSNYDTAQVHEITEEFGEPPAVNQVQYHLAYHNDTLLQAMKDAGTVLEAWAPLGGPTVHGREPSIPLSDARLQQLADRYSTPSKKVSTAQVVLKWENTKGVVPVTATCNKAHAMGDLDAFDLKLSSADMDLLDKLMPELASNVIV